MHGLSATLGVLVIFTGVDVIMSEIEATSLLSLETAGGMAGIRTFGVWIGSVTFCVVIDEDVGASSIVGSVSGDLSRETLDFFIVTIFEDREDCVSNCSSLRRFVTTGSSSSFVYEA
jgi:hypothetical protein